jgi:hypothetical protein
VNSHQLFAQPGGPRHRATGRPGYQPDPNQAGNLALAVICSNGFANVKMFFL